MGERKEIGYASECEFQNVGHYYMLRGGSVVLITICLSRVSELKACIFREVERLLLLTVRQYTKYSKTMIQIFFTRMA